MEQISKLKQEKKINIDFIQEYLKKDFKYIKGYSINNLLYKNPKLLLQIFNSKNEINWKNFNDYFDKKENLEKLEKFQKLSSGDMFKRNEVIKFIPNFFFFDLISKIQEEPQNYYGFLCDKYLKEIVYRYIFLKELEKYLLDKECNIKVDFIYINNQGIYLSEIKESNILSPVLSCNRTSTFINLNNIELSKRTIFINSEIYNIKEKLFLKDLVRNYIYDLKNNNNSTIEKCKETFIKNEDKLKQIILKELDKKNYLKEEELIIKPKENLNLKHFTITIRNILKKCKERNFHQLEKIIQLELDKLKPLKNSKYYFSNFLIKKTIEDNSHLLFKFKYLNVFFDKVRLDKEFKLEQQIRKQYLYKKLSPKKYSFKLKKLINEHLSFYFQIKKSFDDFNLLNLIDLLKLMGVSEKNIIIFIDKIINPKHFKSFLLGLNYEVYKDIDTLEYYPNSYKLPFWNSYGHDLTSFENKLHSNFNSIYSIYSTQNIKELFIKIFQIYRNMDFINAISNNKSEILVFFSYIDVYKKDISKTPKQQIEKIRNVNDLKEFFLNFKKLYIKNLINEAISKQLIKEEYLNAIEKNSTMESFLQKIARTFKENPKIKSDFLETPIFKTEQKYKTNKFEIIIKPHNSILGLLGKNNNSICIDMFGKESFNHLNKHFCNLIIHYEEKIYLWGLLVCLEREVLGEIKYSFILNNLQGSINSKIERKEIEEGVYKTLEKFKKENNLEELFINNRTYTYGKFTKNITKEDNKTYSISFIKNNNKNLYLDFSQQKGEFKKNENIDILVEKEEEEYEG